MSSLTSDLARLANNANVLVSAITTNGSAITSVNVGITTIHTTGITVGNTSIHTTGVTVDGQSINNTSFPGVANNTSYVGSVTAANVVSNAQLQANLANYLPLSGGTLTGNLIVTGTTVTINATTLDVKDLNITVAKGAGSAAAANGAGITVDSGYANLYYSSSSNTWTSTVGLNVLSGNVGFGTSTVGKQFEVVGELVSRASSAAGNNASSFQCDSSGTRIWFNSSYDPVTYTSGWSTALYLSNANGNIGIGGNTSPAAKLTVTGVIESQAQAPCIAFTGDIDQAKWLMKLGAYRLSFLSDGASSGFDSMSYNSRTYYTQFYLSRDGSAVVYGNAGIGTSSPSTRLHIANGSITHSNVGTNYIIADGNGWSFKSDYNLELFADHDNNNSASYQNIKFYTAGSNLRMTIDGSGKVGIGLTGDQLVQALNVAGSIYTVTGADRFLQLGSSSNYWWRIKAVSDDLVIHDASNTALYYMKYNTGNFGIGVSNPVSRLHVNKDIAFTSPENSAQLPMKKRFVATSTQGANNYTYKICTVSRDPLNWSEYGPIEIIARNTYYQGGSYSRWIYTHGYGANPKLVCVESGGISGNIPNLYLGSEVTVNSNLKYTPVYCDVPYYRQFNFEINHNYIESSSITATNQIKFDNTYAANSSATMYGGNVYLAPGGGAVVVGDNPVLSGLAGSFYVGGGRQISFDGGSAGAIYIRGDTGGWGMGMYAVGSSGTNRGGFGWLGGADAVSYYWVGQAYNGTGVQLSYGGNSWATLSDARDKNVHGNIQNALDKIKTITSIYYNYKTDEEGTPRRVGFLAQEVQAVYPEAVTEIQREIENPTEETKRLSLSYTDMIPLLLEAIKELKEEFDKYKETHP